MTQSFDDFAAWFSQSFDIKLEYATPEAALIRDLGFDSVQTLELIIAIEEDLGAEMPDSALPGMTTLGDAYKIFLAFRTG